MENKKMEAVWEAVHLMNELDGKIKSLNELANAFVFLKGDIQSIVKNVDKGKHYEEKLQQAVMTTKGILSKYPFIEKDRVLTNNK